MKRQLIAKKSTASKSTQGLAAKKNTVAGGRTSGSSASAAKPHARATRASSSAGSAAAASKKKQAVKSVAASRLSSPKSVAATPDLYSSIHALLHTMRVIERHEEPLCSMQDELKRTGKLSAPYHRRLRLLVEELPAEIYQQDLEVLRRAIGA